MKEIEIWKDIPDYEGLYQVSNFGRVRSIDRIITNKNGKNHFYKGVILKPIEHKNNYLFVSLTRKKIYSIHKLVALAFIPNPENLPCINHKDENKQNNHVSNLEWCNHSYNMNYGTANKRRSEKRKGFRFTEEVIQKMSASHKGKKQTLDVINKIREQNSKAVLQYSLYGVFIKEWKSVTQASKELNISNSHISECCNGKRKTASGYIWRYK